MRSVLTEKKEHKAVYPKLMIGTDADIEGMVVLFTEQGCGTVVAVSVSNYDLGDVSEEWCLESFTDLEAGRKITLSN